MAIEPEPLLISASKLRAGWQAEVNRAGAAIQVESVKLQAAEVKIAAGRNRCRV